ncbi:E3 ubiquitin ligase TRAF3IP2 [Astyanax mexicanus]|uniref:E3 ubiquitin ligase TRAF3IP2 n=2 Tax=Astyanax mexicanus TaxID=7994 RepID=W5L3V8_ASTMX|nr:E3 ubiquitin ligase TRAF3IP2 [Astyanax mexicanus]
MTSFTDVSCCHPSVPVEMDESMTSSSLNLAWPVCEQCSGQANCVNVTVNDVAKVDYPEGSLRHPESRSEITKPVYPLATPPSDRHWMSREAMDGYLHHPYRPPVANPDSYRQRPRMDDLCEGFSALFPREQRNPPREDDEESLEMPGPLRSDVEGIEYRLANHYRHPGHDGHCQLPANAMDARCPRGCHRQQPPVNPAWFDQNPQPRPSPHVHKVPVATPQATSTAPVRELMSEVCVQPSQPITGPTPMQEMRRTISLPDNCRNVFITYSVDTAKEMFPFVRFLMSQGFRPAIDIFDNAVRQMDMNKWMDSYLKDKSVLIIVVISPKYKIDVEGDGSDQHGLHTKYIYTQIQNEFIQQRCLNFRLVPVLFPNANQSHVPMWLQSTRLFHWPQDAQELLLRLLREERYIPPPLGKELTITIKPLTSHN